jgi:photosystem I subunit 11
MANFIKPYNDDPFVGHLATPITSSAVTRAILQNLPAYRFGLTPLLRGLEIGLAHGYFLMGPFVKLGPLRDSDIGLLAGFLSTIGLIVILTLGLTIYGVATFGQEKSETANEMIYKQKKLGINLKVDFLLVHVEVLDLHLFVYQVFQPLQ